MLKRKPILAFLILFSTAILVSRTYSQDPKKANDDDTIRITTDLVDVPVAVSGANGTFIKGYKAENFAIYEDGVKQEVAQFTHAAAPFEVALLLDTSGSARNDLPLIKRAAENFITLLRPGDRVAIVAFAGNGGPSDSPRIDILSRLTSDRKQLSNALRGLKTSAGTPYYDGVDAIAEKVFDSAAAPEFRGRRAVVALTDGVDSTSVAGFGDIRKSLGDKGLIAYFVRVDTREYFEENLLGDCEAAMRFSLAQIKRYYRTIKGNASMEKASAFCELGDFERLAVSRKLYALADAEMQELAARSGGKVFRASDVSDAQRAFQEVAAEIGTSITLGYYPTNEARDGRYRKIRVEVKGVPRGTVIRYREGYTASPE